MWSEQKGLFWGLRKNLGVRSTLNCYCWTSITMESIYFSRVLRPLNIKGRTQARPLSCGFDSSVGRALHRQRRGRGFESRSKPEFFQVIFLVVLWLYSHLSFFQQQQSLFKGRGSESHSKPEFFHVIFLVLWLYSHFSFFQQQQSLFKGRGFESPSKPEFLLVIFLVVLWLYSHLSFFQQDNSD